MPGNLDAMIFVQAVPIAATPRLGQPENGEGHGEPGMNAGPMMAEERIVNDPRRIESTCVVVGGGRGRQTSLG